MPITPIYTPPNPTVVQSFLAANPQRQPSDYQDEAGASTTVPNTAPTQQGTVLAVSLVPTPSLSNELDSVLSLADSATPKKIVRLTIGNIPRPANPTTFLEIFIGNAKITAVTSEADPHYFRSVSFFCCHNDRVGPLSFLFDVTGHLKKLKANGESPRNGTTVSVRAGALQGVAPAIVPGYFQLTVASQ